MMGYGEEPGIIPRFCEDLFARVAKKHTQEVGAHAVWSLHAGLGDGPAG